MAREPLSVSHEETDFRLRDGLAREVRSFDALCRILCRRVVDSATASLKKFTVDQCIAEKMGDRRCLQMSSPVSGLHFYFQL